MTEPTPDPSPRPTTATRTSDAPLDHSLVHGLAWTSAAKWGSQVLSWTSTLIVARLLSPDDFGLLGMAEAYVGLVQVLTAFGLGASVLAFRDLTDDQVAQLHGFAFVFGAVGFAISCVLAWPLGAFFHAPRLPAVIIVMSLAFVIGSFRIVPAALLQRELRFRELAGIDATRALVLAVAMVAFAFLGFRYWTLVIGFLLGSILATVLTLRLKRQRMARPRISALREAMAYSGYMIASMFVWYAYQNADFVVAGRLVGQAALGMYTLAWTFASLPVEKVTALIGGVAFPVFTAVQHERAELRRYLLRLTEGLALITFPACLGMALVAPEFVLTFLGAKWTGAIVPLQLLALAVCLRSVTPLLPHVLNAIGDARFTMYNAVVSAAIMPVAFYLMATRSGTTGIALVWLLVYPFPTLMLFWRVFRRIELPASQYLSALWPALSSSLIMVGVVLGVRAVIRGHWSTAVAFSVEVALGAVSYLCMVLVFHRGRITAFLTMLRRGRAGDSLAGA